MIGLQWRNRLARGTYIAVLKPSNAEVVSSSLTWSTQLFGRENGLFWDLAALRRKKEKSSQKNYAAVATAWARTRAPCRAVLLWVFGVLGRWGTPRCAKWRVVVTPVRKGSAGMGLLMSQFVCICLVIRAHVST